MDEVIVVAGDEVKDDVSAIYEVAVREGNQAKCISAP
jgi:hypothetical protein